MAVINTLRNKLGKFIVAAVAIAIMSFVLADLLGPNSTLFGGGNDVGEIAGKTISLKEYQAEVQEREANYTINFNRQPTEKERPTLRQQAWDLLIAKYAFQKQYEATGVEVTEDEIWDMVQGKNIDPSLKQAFTNPETGQFDRQQLMSYIQALPQMDPNARLRWDLYLNDLTKGRVRLKYENLLEKSNYVTSAEAQREYHLQNDVAEMRYLYIPYYAIGDSLVNVDDSEIEDYYNDNKEQYKTKETRSLQFVSFDVVPSATDTAFVKEELATIKEEFKSAENDSIFATLNSDADNTLGKFNPESLPTQLQANISNISKGDVRGPYLTSEGFKVYKISDIFEDTIAYAKASHILFKGDDAETKAQEILNELKNGADFAAMAAEHGTDGTASRGGDLGWFESGRMVAPFEEAVFSATEPGLLPKLVETDFGFHIVRVDKVKSNTAYKIATVVREVLPSDVTINDAFSAADIFKTAVDDYESFQEQAQADSLMVGSANNLGANDRNINGLGDARQIVQWLYSNASTGDVSDVFELNDSYVIAVMTDKVSKGYKPISAVRNQIFNKVKKDKQAEIILAKLNTLTGTLDEKAAAYGDDANVYSNSSLLLNANSLPSAGFDPTAVGTAFALNAGEESAPIKGENGILIIQLQNKTIAPEIADYASYSTQVKQKVDGQVGFAISEAIKTDADIVDERYKFY